MGGDTFTWLVVLIAVIPTTTAILIGILAFRGTQLPDRLPYRCQRCAAAFSRPAHRGFPRRCPACRAADWNG